jgi:hypothetical protein
MSLVYRERNQESLRSSPTPTSVTAPDSTTTTDYDESEPLRGKIDAWIEPPLKAPTPSFEDDGLERTDQYVFQYMAPLGHMPPIRLIREITVQGLAHSICQDKRKQNRAKLVSSTTKELGSSVNGLRQHRSAASVRIRANDPTPSNGRRRGLSRSTKPDPKQRIQELRDRKGRAITRR